MIKYTVIPALLALIGCGDGTVDCTTEARASVSLTVTDSAGDPVTPTLATYTVDNGDPANCEVIGAGSVACGWEQAGQISVHLEAAGLASFDGSYTVTDGECHVDGVSDDVVMSPMACTDIAVPSIRVHTVNGTTPADADSVVFSIVDLTDAPPEACQRLDVGEYQCGFEVSGDLLVEATIGDRVVADDVTVEHDECHVITQDLTLDLAP